MSGILKDGQAVFAEHSGLPCEVKELLGVGGQGEVYRAVLGGSEFALKWYYPEWATAAQRSALEHLARMEPPSPSFLWPIEVVSAADLDAFGYLMPLRAPRFLDGRGLLTRRIEPSFRSLATIGLNLAQAFLLLHARGLAYRDISFGNFFVDSKTSEVLVCDLDNVGVDGEPHNRVGGTAEFMAPEICRGEAHPSAQTDLHSLAVLLFYLFMMGHPFEGRKEASVSLLGPEERMALYGRGPVYVGHPTDESNRPVPGRHDNVIAFWPVYPRFLKRMFERSFVEGAHDPTARVRESEWRAAMVQLRDVAVYCQRCKAECFLPLKADGAVADKELTCWSCRSKVPRPFGLKVGTSWVALNQDTKLFAHHIDPKASYDFSRPVAEVSQHPKDPTSWGLRNLTEGTWEARMPNSQVRVVDPGRSVQLAVSTKIRFGASTGEIVYEAPSASSTAGR